MPKVQHIVLLKFKRGAEDRAAPLIAALAELRQRLSGFLHFSAGPYSSPEGLNRGLTHGCLMTFADAAARDSYLTHPDHEKVKERFLPFVEDVVVFDFEESV
jgi:Stress responsive A/B Barrel Domain